MEDHCFAEGTAIAEGGDRSLFRERVGSNFMVKAIHYLSSEVNRQMKRETDVQRHTAVSQQFNGSLPVSMSLGWSQGWVVGEKM